jgi:hypothetical protein
MRSVRQPKLQQAPEVINQRRHGQAKVITGLGSLAMIQETIDNSPDDRQNGKLD